MKALIVEDEPLARQELRGMLADFSWVEVCGEAANAREALQLIRQLQPDLLLLDVQMPGRNGFELLEALPPPHPRVIFTTAYDEYALRAFEVNALDYLQKPIHPDRLAAALAKLAPESPRGPLPNAAATPGDALREDDRIFAREGERCWFVRIGSIRLLSAEDNYTRVFFENEKPLMHRTLASIEPRLPPALFVRANRTQVVNLACVKGARPWFSDSLMVTLTDGQTVEFSRRQARLLRMRTEL